MEYKDSLLMPKTDFEMRANLTSKEPGFQKRWEDQDLYRQMRDLHQGKTPFVLHDGPPYANGNIHIGHALNKILKDVVVRSRHMLGHQVHYVPGWDTHGLPIETAISKLGHNRKSMSVAEFRKLCHEYAQDQILKQMVDFKSLGTIGAYDQYYATLQKDFESAQIEIFAKMALDGFIYKGLKPVFWSPSSESALAEAEIEYHDKEDPAIFVKFNVVQGNKFVDEKDAFVIWTTTPWTIPANLAISLHPDIEYVKVQTRFGRLIVSKRLLESLMKRFEDDHYEVLASFKGQDLELVKTKHPLYERESLVVVSEHVTDEDGTGCVHTAPGHGDDDFIVGMKYGLEAFCPVDEKGCMTIEAGDFLVGQYVEQANQTVIEKLKEVDALLAVDIIHHPYPHDWRTKKPVIYRATDQWFASIDMIREQLLREIDQVQWVPEWGKIRMHNMIKDRGDWCISRQRAWGVPIPIFYTEANTPIMDQAVFEHVAKLFKEHGSNIWFEREAMDLLPVGYTHSDSPNGKFRKETDIMDVWFDSGSSHTGALYKRGEKLPVDLYLEGSDQYRGWFNSSLIVSVAYHGYAPYKTVVSHGFVLDGKGEKMSKSLGNVVEPNKVVKQSGADILRLWACTIDYQSDVRISEDLLKQVVENYKKLRNTFRFMLGNLDQFNERMCQDLNQLPKVDLQIMHRLNEVIRTAKLGYQTYDYKQIVSAINNFMSQDLSAYYLDFTKDILYIESVQSLRRQQVQTVIYYAVDALSRLLAPILVHTMEEVQDHFKANTRSIHLEEFPNEYDLPSLDRKEWNQLFQLRSDALKQLEEARAEKVIGKSLEAKLILHLNEDEIDLINRNVPKLHQWLIVSQCDVKSSAKREILVEKALGSTCPRCWNVTASNYEDGLCERCHEVVSTL
jgi:isoleucyl-tRNA synthetase